jgi:hypothetical protein
MGEHYKVGPENVENNGTFISSCGLARCERPVKKGFNIRSVMLAP